MVDKLSSGFLGCINPCKLKWQNFSINQVKPAGLGLFEDAFPNDMGECEECKARFSLFKRKKLCGECGLNYCNACLRRLTDGIRQCKKCNILSHWPINRTEISSLRIRDLRYFLSTCKIPTNTCKEKQDLIDLVIAKLHHRHSDSCSPNPDPDSHPAPGERSAPNVRDDGIRVRPVNLNPEEAGGRPYDSSGADEAAGIRVFPSTESSRSSPVDVHLPTQVEDELLCNEAAAAAATPPPLDTCATNADPTDSSTSSNWSLLEHEEQDQSSSDILSQSSNLENPSNIPPDDENEILQEIVSTATPQTDPPPPADEGPPSILDTKHTSAANVIKLSSLETEESIRVLSVRQCKEILILHRVDFSGVWEKHELTNKVKMLWKDYRQRVEEGKNLSEDQMCKICMDAAMDCVLLECGHIVSCTNCGKQMAECPMCRQNVIRVVKTFRA